MDPLHVTLRKIRWRLALQRGLYCVLAGLLVSLSFCSAWLVITRLFPLLPAVDIVGLAMVAAGLVAAAIWALRTRPSILDTAIEVDRRLGMQERVTSSLQLADVEHRMVEALHRDAREQLARRKVSEAFPFRFPLVGRWLAIPIVAFGVAYLLMPELDLFGFQQRQVEAKAADQARKVQAERLKNVARPLIEQAESPDAERLGDAATQIERLAEQLASGELTEKQALAKLGNLADEIQQRRDALQPAAAMPKVAENLAQMGAAQEAAKALMNGDFGEAAKQLRDLEKKLKEGNLSADEKKHLGEDLKKLSESLNAKEGGSKQSSALSEALAKAASALDVSQMSPDALQEGSETPEGAALSIEDAASIMEQLDKLNAAMKDIRKWEQETLGPSEYCRVCGMKLKPCTGGKGCKKCGAGHTCYGICEDCVAGGWCNGAACNKPWRAGESVKFGNGMGGAGHGRGSSTGPLPDVDDAFSPTLLPGEIIKGKFLADIVQRTAPEAPGAPAAQFVAGVVAEAKQKAEQALTKEEIPPASREFVRQYFSTIDAPEPGSPGAAAAP